MKLLYFDDYRLGVLGGNDQVIDLTDVVSDIPHLERQDLMRGLIERFDAYRKPIEEKIAKGGGVAVGGVRLRPPLPKPANIICMAANYMENGTKSEPAPINAFAKARSGIIGPGDTMDLGDVPATIFEGEAEIAAVIGKPSTKVSRADAMSHIFGYVNFIDGSARGLTSGFYLMKSRDTYAPVGPYLVTADEIKDPAKVAVKLWNNGVLMQDYNTDDMAHPWDRCVEFATATHSLEPGDILAAGTNHRGLNPFMDGDRIELECAGLGRLVINVRDEHKRTWARETRLERAEKGLQGSTPQLTGKYAPAK